MNPIRVNVAGGTLVTITGTALPLNPAVRVGDAAAATVVRSSATELVFRAPARAEGSYWVHVFARDGRVRRCPIPWPTSSTAPPVAAPGRVTVRAADPAAAPAPDGSGSGWRRSDGPATADDGSGDDSDESDSGSGGSPGRSSGPARTGSGWCGRRSSPRWARSGR